MRIEKVICDRCGEELKYNGWTARYWLPRKRPFRFKLAKLYDGNKDGYGYIEREYELCQKCTLKFDAFLRGRELADERAE